MRNQCRQGDVFMEQCEAPKDTTTVSAEQGLAILARGEATGHHHSVASTDAAIIAKGAERYLRVHRATTIQHQEHRPIQIARGLYEVTIQVEFDPTLLARIVMD